MTEYDKYQTPLDIANYMANLIVPFSNVFEPTPGHGNLVKALKSSGHNVDYPHGNFFDFEIKVNKYDAIVMNPPFSSKSANLDNAPDEYKASNGMSFGYKMLSEMMLKSDRVVALMPWFTISDSDVRLRAIKRYGLKSITLLPRKTFDYARIQTCILDMEKGFEGVTEFIVYDTINDHLKPKLEL